MKSWNSHLKAVTAHLLGCVIVLLALAPTAAFSTEPDNWRGCVNLSFAPLDHTVPACTELLGSDDLSNDRRIDALVARANAYLFAVTYHLGHEVQTETLLEQALADLNRAEAITREDSETDVQRAVHVLRERGGVLYQLGRFDQSVADYSAAIARSGASDSSIFFARALAYEGLGRFKDALADINVVILATLDEGSKSGWYFHRARIHEAAGHPDAAIADYRQTLKGRPDHGSAAEALRRLGASP